MTTTDPTTKDITMPTDTTPATASALPTTTSGIPVPDLAGLPAGVLLDGALDCGLSRHVRTFGNPTRPHVTRHPLGTVLRVSRATAARLAQHDGGAAAPCAPDGRWLDRAEQAHLPRDEQRLPYNREPDQPSWPSTPQERAQNPQGPVVDYTQGEPRAVAVVILTPTTISGQALTRGQVVAMPAALASRVVMAQAGAVFGPSVFSPIDAATVTDAAPAWAAYREVHPESKA